MKHRHNTYLIFAALAAAVLWPTATSAAAPKKATSSIVTKCKSDLAARLKLKTSKIALVDSQPVTWPDAALGMPEPGKMYAQVLTPGFRVTLKAGSTTYLYTTSSKSIKYAGPVSTWSYSLLYTKPVENEPNLNGDLYQCSLLGTNCTRLASGVTDIYPQAKGAIIATRRTSRSGFDLLLINAAQPGKTKKLYSAFEFGAAALNDKQDKWAAFVKPMLGREWGVMVAPVNGSKAKSTALALPDNVRPGSIAWSNDKVMVLSKTNDAPMCYEMSPGDAKPAWKQVGAHEFPGPEYMLNRSQSLEISQITENGKPAVEVAKVWFTGNHDVIAKIPGVIMQTYDFVGGRWAFVSGRKDDKPVAYTVDIGTGEVIAAAGITSEAKPFIYPPRSTPLAKKP